MTIRSASMEADAKFEQVKAQYEYYDHQHAVAILTMDYPELMSEICDVLLRFRLTLDQIQRSGGNESEIPKTFSTLLRPLGWNEQKLKASLTVDDHVVSSDTHKIDYIKGEAAFDLEWNSKDQTFDRDLYAFRAFFDYRKISVGILVTRSDALDEIFRELGWYDDSRTGARKRYLAKYGASTTHMSKLIPRLKAGRSGGCPVLAMGITDKQVQR